MQGLLRSHFVSQGERKTMREFDFERVVKNPAVYAEGRLPAHAYFTPYRNEAELSAGERRFNSS